MTNGRRNFAWDDGPCWEVERYELHEPPRYQFGANRREFVQTLGAGLMLTFATPSARAQTAPRRGARGGARREDLTDRFHIAEDGIVTVLTSKVDCGQDARTQITQAAAEELHLPVDRVRVLMADTALCPDDGGTAGSRTTPATIPRVRSAAAAARELLIDYAAGKMGVERAKIRYAAGVFQHGADRRLTLSDLAKDPQLVNSLQAEPRTQIEVQRVEDWQVLGTSVPKVRGRQVVTGSCAYPSDIRRPNMLYGCVLRPPTREARLVSVNLAVIHGMEGVEAVRDGEFIGCVAPNSWDARRAVSALEASSQWEIPPRHVSSDQLFAHLKETAGRSRDEVWGEGAAQLENAAETYAAEFTVAYIQHAPLEPRAAVAQWEDGKLTVWTGTQQPSRVQTELATAFRLSPERVRVVVPDFGSGFGGKHTGEAAVEAARLARSAGRPVSLRWSREEECTWAYCRPAGVIEVHAGLDTRGGLVGWDFANYNSGASAIATPYKIPHGRTRFFSADSPLRQGSYRALASTANTFARESAMDELAERARMDPLAFRLRHLGSGRLRDVLEVAADTFGWTKRRSHLLPGHGIGLACGTEKGSFVAACAEVEVVDGRLHVLEVCQAFECGAIHNPRNLRAQVEGCLVMGLGGALWEKVEFRDGRIRNPNFSSYRVPRVGDLPKTNIVLVDRPDLPSVGGGETPIIAIAPALANAAARAGMVRPRSLPFF